MSVTRQPHFDHARLGAPSPSSMRPTAPDEAAAPARSAYANLSFEMPRSDYVESVMIAFRTPGNASSPAPTIGITRELMRPGDALRTHADRKLARIGKEAPEFDLLESHPMDVHGHPAILLRFTWRSHLGSMEQTMLLALPADEPDRKVTVLNVVGPIEQAETTRRVFEELVATVRFDAPPRGQRSSRPPSADDSSPRAMADMVAPPFVPMPGQRGR
jgi:hypothetical protein